MATRIITNITQSPITLNDMMGKTLEANESFDGNCFGESRLRDSVDVQLALLAGQIKVSDGVLDFYGQAGVDLIRGYATQVTWDGKQIVTASDRPKDHYRCFTGNSDDISSSPNRIGRGAPLHLIAQPGGTATVEAHFTDDVYIRDGSVQFINCGFDTHITCDIVCPANIPFPSPTHTGTLDLVNGQFVPNTNGTGAYMTAPIEVTLFRFINELPLVGSGMFPVNSPEPFLLVKPYFMRFSLTAPQDNVGEAKAAITLGMYRKSTV